MSVRAPDALPSRPPSCPPAASIIYLSIYAYIYIWTHQQQHCCVAHEKRFNSRFPRAPPGPSIPSSALRRSRRHGGIRHASIPRERSASDQRPGRAHWQRPRANLRDTLQPQHSAGRPHRRQGRSGHGTGRRGRSGARHPRPEPGPSLTALGLRLLQMTHTHGKKTPFINVFVLGLLSVHSVKKELI